MYDKTQKISGKDITFTCPACAKGLVIDALAAGRSVKCPECGTPVEVPSESEANLLEDVRDLRIRELSQALERSEGKVKQLTETLREYQARRTNLETARSESMGRLDRIVAEMNTIRAALDKIGSYISESRADDPGDESAVS